MATQTALARVSREARGVGEESASEVVVSTGPSSEREEGESVAIIATFLASEMSCQRQAHRGSGL